MRVGNLETAYMSIEEIDNYLTTLNTAKIRKERAASLHKQMNRLIEKAKNEGFTFIDKDYGFVRDVDDFVVFDEKA